MPALLVEIAALQTALAARLAAVPVSEPDDKLMDVTEAAAMLGGVSADFPLSEPSRQEPARTGR